MPFASRFLPLAPLLWATQAQACTLCYSRTAVQVRAAVLGADFWANLAALAAPVPLLLAGIMLLRRLSP